MALSNLLPVNSYPEEPKTYTTTATLNLKPSQRSLSLGRTDLQNFTFEWHTNVITPPNTPASPIAQKKTLHTTDQSNKLLNPGKNLFLPAFTYEESDGLLTQLDKFMNCERYHSQTLGRSTNL